MAKFSVRALIVVVLLAVFVGGSSVGSSAAPGTFPGTNGVIGFDGLITGGGCPPTAPGSIQIFTISSTGTGLTQVTPSGEVWNQDPTFSANGAKIYGTSTNRCEAGPSEIFSMNIDGSGRQVIGPGVWPSVNQSGSTIAAVQFRQGGRSVIVTMNPDGTRQKVVSTQSKKQASGSPDYASTGQLAWYRVTFNKSGDGFAASDIFVRNKKHNTNITRKDPAQYFLPAWAPDGQTLLAIQGEQTIVSMNADGTGVHVLTTISGAETSIASAVYSPDGTKIAFLQCDGDCGDPELQGQGSIWVMNADGTGKQLIFNGTSAVQPADRLSWSVS